MRASAISRGPTGRRLQAVPYSLALGMLLNLLNLLGLLACHDAATTISQRPCDDRPIRMGVASSLREIAENVTAQLTEAQPTIQVESIFGASSTHARQLGLGAPFDVLVSADADLMATLEESALINRISTREIARGRLILLGRAAFDLPIPQTPLAAVFSRDDLHRIAVPSEVVPLGRYARAWLRGRDLLQALEGKLVTTEHARASLSAVEAGHVDLAFAYASDRRLLSRAQFLAELDPKDYPPIRYVAAQTMRASDCENAETVLAAWSSAATRSAFDAAGFSLPGSREVRP